MVFVNEIVHLDAQLGNGYRSAAFESEITVIAGIADCTEDVVIIDLTGTGLLSSGIVADVEVTDQIDVCGCIADDVAFGDLLMIEIKEDLAVGGVDCTDHFDCLLGRDKVVAHVVNEDVERLQDDHDAFFLGDMGQRLERTDTDIKLLLGGNVGTEIADRCADVGNVHLLCRRDRFTEGINEDLTGIFPDHTVRPCHLLTVFGVFLGLDDDTGGGYTVFVERCTCAIKIEVGPSELFHCGKPYLAP